MGAAGAIVPDESRAACACATCRGAGGVPSCCWSPTSTRPSWRETTWKPSTKARSARATELEALDRDLLHGLGEHRIRCLGLLLGVLLGLLDGLLDYFRHEVLRRLRNNHLRFDHLRPLDFLPLHVVAPDVVQLDQDILFGACRSRRHESCSQTVEVLEPN